MPKKVIQYQVGYETYSTRWIAETIATLIQDGYLNNDYLTLTYVENGFRINYGDKTTITVKESESIKVVQEKTTATSEEILKLIKKGWTYTYNGANIYNIPIKTNHTNAIKDAMVYFIKNLAVNPLPHLLEITERIYYKTHGELFENKNLAHIFEDVLANKKLEIKKVDTILNDIHIALLTKRISIVINKFNIQIKTELHQKVTSEHILKYDELGYNWSTDGRYATDSYSPKSFAT